jgi:glyoxylase-like metal-dependent hydrolase (beta-lactamase superfamily II)
LKGNERIDLYYFGAGHTNGDTLVVFSALRTMHTGDLFPNKGTPFMDNINGGSGLEYPKTLAKALAGIKGVETIIPGHAPVMTWNDFKEFSGFVQEMVTAISNSKKAGKTADEAAAEYKPSEPYKNYGMGRLKPNAGVIYAELK